jgi:hypothetical protein
VSPGSHFHVSTFFGLFSVSQIQDLQASPRWRTGRVKVATSRIGARGILVETGGGCQERRGGVWGAGSAELRAKSRERGAERVIRERDSCSWGNFHVLIILKTSK